MNETALAGRPGVDGLPCGWLRVDHRGLIVRANARLAQLAGREGVVEGLYFDDLLTLPSRVLFQSHLSPLLRLNGETAELNVALRRSDGAAPLDVLLYSCRAEDLPGHIDFVVVPIRQRRRIEEELVRVKRAADQAPLMLFQLVSMGGNALRFDYASQSVRQLYGCTPEAAGASAQAVTGRLSPESAAALAGALDSAARVGIGCRLNLELMAEPGKAARTHEFVASPRSQRDGHTLWHGYIADITERLQLQREAAEREGARQAAQLRRDFLARASHELRTPLNAILGFAQLLGQAEPGQLRPDQMQALATLQTAGRHMLALVSQLLDLSRAEREGNALPLHAVRLAPELAAAAEAWRGPAGQKGLRLDVLLPPELGDTLVLAEPVTLRQVLDNLLSNAVKFTPEQGHVCLQAAVSGDGRLCISVADDGPGLDEAQRAHLFEPFNRLGAERGPTEGSGLGLVLSRRLVQALGGELLLDAGPGRGCRFGFELARAPHPSHDAEPVPTLALPTTARPPATRGCVLYVEDNEVNVLLMQAIAAQRPGVQLHVAYNGQEAEALLDEQALRPDLLLLDLNLPDTDGPKLLKRLRQRPALAAVPALLVTATTGEDAAAASGDFQGCWFKPLDLGHTLTELDRLLA